MNEADLRLTIAFLLLSTDSELTGLVRDVCERRILTSPPEVQQHALEQAREYFSIR